MTNIQEVEIPAKSIIHNYLTGTDYADAFKMKIPDTYNSGIDELSKELFDFIPSWVNSLMKLRHVLVRPFGLKTGLGKHSGGESKHKADLFTVLNKSFNEILMGEQDKHLDFWLSLYLEEDGKGRYITASTVVKYNNRFGRLYFMLIRPFHKIIVPAIMRHNLKNL